MPEPTPANAGLAYLTYTSSAVDRFSQNDLKRLLDVSRRKNSVIDVTGLLLYRDARFLQYLEGPQETVNATFNHIRQDRRHMSVRAIASGELAGRLFPEWSMGYKNLAGIRASNTTGYSECLQPDFRPAEGGDPSERLARLFCELLARP